MPYRLDYGLVLSGSYGERLLDGIITTLVLFLLCLSAGFVLALVLTALEAAPGRVGRVLVRPFIEFQRNVPILVHLLVWYFGLAALLPLSASRFMNNHGAESAYAFIALSLYTAAYMAEELRGGLRAIPKIQYESARAIGLGFVLTMRLVIIPQAIRLALPPLVNQSLSLFKNTSVAAAIGVAELMYNSREVQTETFRVFEIFSIATLAYALGSVAILGGGHWLRRQLQMPLGASSRA